MRRLKLELRRMRGLLAYHWVMMMPVGWRRLWWPLLPWAGLFAHYDEDRSNWELDALASQEA